MRVYEGMCSHKRLVQDTVEPGGFWAWYAETGARDIVQCMGGRMFVHFVLRARKRERQWGVVYVAMSCCLALWLINFGITTRAGQPSPSATNDFGTRPYGCMC